jgi:hypothetical protein
MRYLPITLLLAACAVETTDQADDELIRGGQSRFYPSGGWRIATPCGNVALSIDYAGPTIWWESTVTVSTPNVSSVECRLSIYRRTHAEVMCGDWHNDPTQLWLTLDDDGTTATAYLDLWRGNWCSSDGADSVVTWRAR